MANKSYGYSTKLMVDAVKADVIYSDITAIKSAFTESTYETKTNLMSIFNVSETTALKIAEMNLQPALIEAACTVNQSEEIETNVQSLRSRCEEDSGQLVIEKYVEKFELLITSCAMLHSGDVKLLVMQELGITKRAFNPTIELLTSQITEMKTRCARFLPEKTTNRISAVHRIKNDKARSNLIKITQSAMETSNYPLTRSIVDFAYETGLPIRNITPEIISEISNLILKTPNKL